MLKWEKVFKTAKRNEHFLRLDKDLSVLQNI